MKFLTQKVDRPVFTRNKAAVSRDSERPTAIVVEKYWFCKKIVIFSCCFLL